MPIVEVQDLVKKFADFTAVNGISFHLEAGEIFGLLGPNGAGKTTTIHMLVGLARITAGTIKVAGLPYPRGLKPAQRLIGVVPDESNLYEELDGLENLCFCGSLYGMVKKEREGRARGLLERFGLIEAGNRPFKAYSKGMKRKLTIAAALMHSPQILFLDEPTTGIDVAAARQIRALIQELHQQGITILLTTHYIEEAERLCQRIAFLVKGKIIRTGTTAELLQETEQDHLVQFTLTENPLPLKDEITRVFPDLRVEVPEPHLIRFRSPSPLNIAPLAAFFDRAGLSILEAKRIRPSLEDVFVKVTGIELQQMKEDKGRSRS